MHFLGRYRMDERDPLQRSATCVVRLATDNGTPDMPGVVLKLMQNRRQFEMELLNRRGMLDLGCVIGVRGFHAPLLKDPPGDAGGAAEEKGGDLGSLSMNILSEAPSFDLGSDPELLTLQRPETRRATAADQIDAEYPYILVSSGGRHSSV